MPVSFIVAILIAILSLGFGLLGLAADGMSDAPGKTSGVAPYVVMGLIAAALVAASHWMAHLNW